MPLLPAFLTWEWVLMIDYKSQFKADVGSVFLDPNIFAEWHDIDGLRVKALLDKVMTQDDGPGRVGVFINQLRVYVRTEDIQPVPVEDEIISIDGFEYYVRSVSDEDGVLVILCEKASQ